MAGTSLFSSDAFSSLLSCLFQLFTLLLCICAEIFIFLSGCNISYHLLPFSCMLLFPPLLRRLFSGGSSQVYVVNFSCLRPPRRLRVPTSSFLEHLSLVNIFEKDSIKFMAKVMSTAGVGEETYLPSSLHSIPPRTHQEACISEAEMLLFPALDDLLSKTGVGASDIDILVVNCSGFCPAPSLASMFIHRYSMRDDVLSFNLSGMGCGGSAFGVDVASNLLKLGRGSYALVLSTEVLSTGWYNGRDRRKLLINCFFRSGGAAVLLTNRRSTSNKYRLAHLLRTHHGYNDVAYRFGIREEDSEGVTGFSIDPSSVKVFGETLRQHIVAVGRRILPVREKIRYVAARMMRKDARPDFGSGVQHYCMPPSGMPVIEELGRRLGLDEDGTEAARMTFRRFGNQSSASIWYQMAYAEAKGRVVKGDRVWMLGLGTGPKCASVVWECLREFGKEERERGPWTDCIDRFPPFEEKDDKP